MANRPTDWHVLDLDRDPVPGDPYEVKELARKLGDFADDVSSALRSVRGLSGNNAVQDWAGLAADAYREQFGDLPGELAKLEKSYRLASGALEAYWPKLETAQGDADRALAQGRTARQDLDAAKTTQTNANDWVKRAGDKSKEYQADPKPGVEPPSAEEVRTATRNALDASNAQKSANSAVHDAQQRLDAAKELAAQAAHLRDTAASTAEHALHEASDAGIKNKHWWEKAVDWVADHWDDIVAVCKVIVAVLGIIVMIIGGPLAWIVLAAALVVLADTLIKYAQGKASLWDVLFAAMDCIPGFKGLTTAGGLLKMAKNLPKLMKGMGGHLTSLAGALRKGASWMRKTGVTMLKRNKCNDPIDIATGEMVMSGTDVALPGTLPLILERHHVSSYRAGRWLGRSWASSFDQRLVLDDQGVRYTSEDGMVLYYPIPRPGVPVLPVTGPGWSLEWDGTPGSGMSIFRPDSRLALRFAPLARPTELPIASITDPNGNRITFSYNDRGVPTEIVHDGGYRIGVDTEDDRITALRLLNDPDLPVLVRYGYDADRNLAEIVDSSGRPLRLSYDARARITGWEDRNGTRFGYEYGEDGRVVGTHGSDGFLSSTLMYDDETRTTTLTNTLGHRSVYQHNDAYRLIRKTDPLGRVTLQEWDADSRVITAVTDPMGLTSHFRYDDAGNLTVVERPDGATATAEYNALNLPVRITEPGGQVWVHAYDERGNCVSTTGPDGVETRYSYDDAGHVVTETDALGNQLRLVNNPAGLPVVLTDPLEHTTTVERDAFGRISTFTDAMGHATRLGWTPEGRRSWRQRADGTRESWEWDGEGNLLSHTSPTGLITSQTMTHFDMLASTTTPDGVTYDFSYDTELNLTQVTNPQGLTWEYEYDAVGRLISETDFNGRTVGYAHNATDHLVARTNGAGERLDFVRDALGRMTELRSGDGTTTFAYAPTGPMIHAVNADTVMTREYDDRGRLLTETVNGRTIAYTYDALGRRSERRTPAGAVSAWTFDAAGRPEGLDASGHRLVFRYDAADRPTASTLGPGLTLSQTFDAADRLTSQSLARSGPDAQRTLLQNRTYTFRADNYLAEIDEPVTGTRRFDLDPMGRVTAVHARGWAETYAYDAAGNITMAAETDGAVREFESTGTMVRRAGRTTREHDAQGRVIRTVKRLLNGQTRTSTFTWNAEDRLTGTVTPDGTRWRYTYDPMGRRTAKQRLTDDGTVAEEIRFTWDETRLVEQTTETDSVTTWDYVPGTHRPVGQLDQDLSQDEVDARFHAIVTDVVGTPTELFSPEGDLAWRQRTTLWGSPAPVPDAESAVDCPLRFPGQYADPETGWNYNFFRHYDPETAQYVTPDPLGLEPFPNQYAYVVNPFGFGDPLGLAPCSIDKFGWGGSVRYGKLDDLGRPTGINAAVRREMLDKGSEAGKTRTPGWRGDGTLFNEARGHLLAGRLGGAGKGPFARQNLVTLTQNPVNSPLMRDLVEGEIYQAVKNGEIVQYSVTPIYEGANRIPIRLEYSAYGNKGFELSGFLDNPAAGVRIPG
ncbi:DUF6531 domain-containing protein [Streptomyces fildesensis]|uniref:DUF6531 domain-containing protein n=1 Tax=Streptomyces fildesensis TaxID=375757 RepID=A0ABW8C7F1_9ACTN